MKTDFVRNKRTCETLKKECVPSEILVKEIYILDCKIGFASFVSIFPIITALDPFYWSLLPSPGGGGVLPYMGYTGMCRCEGYGFQAGYSGIGYINQRVWV